MATISDATTDAPQRPAPARGPFLLAAAAAAVLAVASPTAGLMFDEAYFAAAGRWHLAWGYLDQPPLVPALAGWLDAVAPGNLFLLRLPVTLGVALVVLLAGTIARELGGGRGAQTLASAAVAVSGALLLGHWFATYALDPVWWTLIVWLVVRWMSTRDDRLLLVAGVVTGLSLNTKFLVPALWAAILLGVAAFGPRALLRRPALWVGLGIAAAMAGPTLAWQVAHGLPYMQMGTVVTREWEGAATFAVSAFALPGLVGTPLVLLGIVRSVVARRNLALVAALAGVAVVIAAVHGRSYYLVSVFPALTAVGAVELARWRPGGWLRRVLAWPAFAASLVLVVVLLPVLPIPGTGLMTGGESTMRPAAQAAAASWRALPPDRQARTALFTQIYPMAAAVDADRSLGTPLAYSLHRGYGWFAPPPESVDAALWVGLDDGPGPLRPWFRDCREWPSTGLPTWLCTGRTVPWSTVYDKSRTI